MIALLDMAPIFYPHCRQWRNQMRYHCQLAFVAESLAEFFGKYCYRALNYQKVRFNVVILGRKISDILGNAGKLKEGLRSDSLVGKIIADRYEILSVLGRGGMGVVLKARQKHLDRICAVKVLTANPSDSSGFERFEREAKVASALASDNIVSVFDFGIAQEGFAYLVMEFINGESLEDLVVREGRIEASRAIPLFLCITNALRFAHEKGAIHRDLKPSNVMVARDEHGQESVKLVDFGMAKYYHESEDQAHNLTTMGKVQGTPAYMSPEQCLGRPLDHRSDIYSLGCIIYRVVMGAMPFSASSVFEAMNMHVSAEPNPIKSVAPDLVLPSALEMAILKCLNKRPEDRYQSVMDLRADLEVALLACWSNFSDGGVSSTQSGLATPYDANDLDSLKTASSLGNTGAQFHLALAYRDGLLLDKDEAESMALLKRAAEGGNAQAQYELGVCFDFGDYLEMDPVKAAQWYKKAAEQGVPGAMVNLACLLEGDRGIETDYQKMLYWYRRAAESGHSLGQSNYARCLYYGIGTPKRWAEAVSWLQASIASDDTNDGALYLLGICYYFGDGVNADRAQAVEYYRMAAKLDHGGSACELGQCYLDGDGVERDVEEGKYWLQRAVDLGSKSAQSKLDAIESQSVMAEVEVDQVVGWLATTDVESLQEAQLRLRSLLQEPVDRPLRQIISTLKLWADDNIEHAIIILAKCYEKGIGVSKDLEKACELYLRAFEYGSELAERELTICYCKCFESEIFPADAPSWLKLSADRRNVNAMISLAIYYRNFNPDGRNFKEALRWHRKAAESGDRDAQYLLARFLTMKNLNKRERERLVRWWVEDVDKDFDPTSVDDFDEDGFATERAEALKWLHKAAEEGSVDALRFLASLKSRGLFMEQSNREAMALMQRAADLDDPEATALLAVALIEGMGGEKNPTLGASLLEKAATVWRHPFAEWNLALELIEGKNMAVDRPRAKELLESSAESAFPQDRYFSEDGFQGRFKRLITLFEDLSKRGQKEARYWLGICCERGIGVEKDRDRSMLLYLQATEQGYEPSRRAFDRAPDNLKNLARKRFLQQDFDRITKKSSDKT